MKPKFRVFDKKYKKIMKVNEINFEKSSVWVEADSGDHENRHTLTRVFEDLILMQSTGLFDIHGVEIFEGDVLEVRSELFTNFGTEATGEYSTEIKQVIWILDSWGTKRLGSDYESKQLSITSKYGTVIGNIYENPELLEDV